MGQFGLHIRHRNFTLILDLSFALNTKKVHALMHILHIPTCKTHIQTYSNLETQFRRKRKQQNRTHSENALYF